MKAWGLHGRAASLLLQLRAGQAKDSLPGTLQTCCVSLAPCKPSRGRNVTLSAWGRCHLLAYQAPLLHPMCPYEAFPSCSYHYFRTT